MRALIVDDEPLARDGVRLLAEREPDVAVVGECGSAADAEQAIRALAPDVVFLDVQLPAASGLELAARLDTLRGERGEHAAPPLVVFVTAYDAHAVRAFDLHAVDYLLKPVDPDRFADAVRRLRGALAASARAAAHERLLAAIGDLRAPDRPAHADDRPAYLERISVRIGSKLVVVRVSEIEWIAADGDYMRIHVGGRSALLRMTMAELERRLDPRRFLRVHRSAIANLDAVQTVEVGAHGDHVLRLRDGSRIRLSRSHRGPVLAALGAGL